MPASSATAVKTASRVEAVVRQLDKELLDGSAAFAGCSVCVALVDGRLQLREHLRREVGMLSRSFCGTPWFCPSTRARLRFRP